MATLVGLQKDLNSLLENLIELDFDAIEAYETAIERIENESIKAQLGEFRNDHVRHTQDLGRILQESGRKAPTKGDVKRVLTKGKVVLAGMMGDKAILMAMKTNEDDTNQAYERAVDSDVAPGRVKDVFRRCLDDERRHRAWIEHRISSM